MAESERLKELEALREAALAELDAAVDDAALEAWRIAYLGRSGKLTQVLRGVSSLPAEQRPAVGAMGNEAKAALEARLAAWDDIPWHDLAFPSVRWALHDYREYRSGAPFAARSNPPGELGNL